VEIVNSLTLRKPKKARQHIAQSDVIERIGFLFQEGFNAMKDVDGDRQLGFSF